MALSLFGSLLRCRPLAKYSPTLVTDLAKFKFVSVLMKDQMKNQRVANEHLAITRFDNRILTFIEV